MEDRAMRAIAIEDFGGPERLQLMSLPRPKPGNKQVLIARWPSGSTPWTGPSVKAA